MEGSANHSRVLGGWKGSGLSCSEDHGRPSVEIEKVTFSVPYQMGCCLRCMYR